MAPKTQPTPTGPTKPQKAAVPATKPVQSRNKASSFSTSPQAQLDALSRSITSLRTAYIQTTPIRIKLIDSFLAFFVVIGVLLMAYRIGVTSYPFNGFLASFGGVVGQFVLMAGLRSQVAPGRDEEYGEVISPER
jgi:oligosaccharyltransferase complex subunit epsilon